MSYTYKRLSLIIILLLFLASCTTKKQVYTEQTKKEVPVTVIEVDDIENDTELSTMELLYVMALKLPVPDIGSPYQDVINGLKNKDVRYIKKDKEVIKVQVFAIDADTESKFPFLMLTYFFKDGLLQKGPISEGLATRTNMILDDLNISTGEL